MGQCSLRLAAMNNYPNCAVCGVLLKAVMSSNSTTARTLAKKEPAQHDCKTQPTWMCTQILANDNRKSQSVNHGKVVVNFSSMVCVGALCQYSRECMYKNPPHVKRTKNSTKNSINGVSICNALWANIPWECGKGVNKFQTSTSESHISHSLPKFHL